MEVVDDMSLYFLFMALVFLVLGISMAVVLYIHKKSMEIAIDVIDAAADFLSGTILLKWVSVMYFFIQLIVVIVWMLCMGCINSMATVTPYNALTDEQKQEFASHGIPQLRKITFDPP